MTRVLIGIDDTDNLESRGTGFRARDLAREITRNHLGILKGITRHQLFFDRRIPYTSHNSSACLEIESNDPASLITCSREYLLRESAPGSDAGLAVALFEQVGSAIVDWGLRAKKEILTQEEARQLAGEHGIHLEGLTGTRDGIIGSLAALGLRKSGNDGRYIGVGGREIRELKGVLTGTELFREIRIDAIEETNGTMVPVEERINTGDWMRPVLRNHKITLIAEKAPKSEAYEWQTASKEYIKSITG
jgi:tRNA(Ile2) C34 agmatinyltransferase TiaS